MRQTFRFLAAPSRRLALIGVLLLGTLGFGTVVSRTAAQDSDSSSQAVHARAVEAALVVRFCQYTTWPESSFSREDDPLVIAVWHADELAKTLDKLIHKKNDQHAKITVRTRALGPEGARQPTRKVAREIEIRVLEELPRPDDLHVLLIGPDRRRDLKQLQRLYGDRPILTIGTAEGHAESGCVLSLYIRNRRPAFEVCRVHERRAMLELHSGLLRNATIVCD